MVRTSKKLSRGLRDVQSRFLKQAQVEQARKTAEQKSRKPSGHKGKPRQIIPLGTTCSPRAIFVDPFKPRDTIFLIGEGDFSFAQALIRGGHEPALMTATAYDTESVCYEKYPDAVTTVQGLRAGGAEVVFGVDATKIGAVGQHKWRGRTWDKIVWNFPHAGAGIADQDRNIRINQELILHFLLSTVKLLKKGKVPLAHAPSRKRKGNARLGSEDNETDEDISTVAEELHTSIKDATRGTVLITLHDMPAYTQWDIPRLAKRQTPFRLLRSFTFDRAKYANLGYEHRLTKGGTRARGRRDVPPGDARTWEFWAESESDS